MSYSNVYQPCDHVTLFLTGKDGTDKGSTIDRVNYYFDIPTSKYFSNDRGSMCTVQVAAGLINVPDEKDASVFLMSGSANGFTVNDKFLKTGGDDPPATVCIAHQAAFRLLSTGEHLITARPERIHLKLVYTDGDSAAGGFVAPPATVAGAITLKFTYYDAVQSTVNMKNHQDYRQLKGGRSSYI